MSVLEQAQSKYLAVPRELDARLDRKARGDRGCLFDLISLAGILIMFGCLIASQMGLIAFSWTYLGAAIWVGSYFFGLTRQSKSAKLRRAALESGPLVLGAVVRCTPHLRAAGAKRAGRAVVVYSLDEGLRFDAHWLEGVAEGLAAWPALDAGVTPIGPQGRARRLLHDEFCFEGVDLGGVELEGQDLPAGTWLARVVVDPELLSAPLSGRGAQLPLIVDPTRNFAEHV